MNVSVETWIGRQLAGDRYLVTDRLGEGGMGLIYLAFDKNTGSQVVIKVPKRSLIEEDGEFKDRFLREIRSLVKLEHPHIVRVTDVGEHDGLPYAVMQYLSGGSLKDRKTIGPDGKHQPVQLGALVEWLGHVATALDFIHGKSYIHRDVKPGNILFDKHGYAYLSDFGIAKVLATSSMDSSSDNRFRTMPGMTIGTPEYMAPELVMSSEYDGRIDQYALAMTIYEMLVGKPAFTATTPSAVMVLQTNTQPSPPHAARPEIPRAVSDVVLKGLAKEARNRYPTCQAFVQALAEAAGVSLGRGTPPRATTVIATRTLTCPVCTNRVQVAENLAGATAVCGSCQAQLHVNDDLRSLLIAATAEESSVGGAPVPPPPGAETQPLRSGGPATPSKTVPSPGPAVLPPVENDIVDLQAAPSLWRVTGTIVGGLASIVLLLVGVVRLWDQFFGETVVPGPPVVPVVVGPGGNDSGGNGGGENNGGGNQDPQRPPSTPVAGLVSLDGDGQFKSLTEAIAASEPGATLHVKPGLYQEPGLALDKPLKIVGDGPRETVHIVLASPLTCTGQQVELESLWLECTAPHADEEEHATAICRGELALTNCQITGPATNCLYATSQGANLKLVNCSIQQAGRYGLHLATRAHLEADDCQFVGAQSHGLLVEGKAVANLTHCTLAQSGGSGVRFDPGGEGLLEECTISANREAGLFFAEQSGGTVQKTTISAGLAEGVVTSRKSAPQFSDCLIFDNAQVNVLADGNAVFVKCEVHGGQAGGVRVPLDGEPRFEACQVFDIEPDSAIVVDGGQPKFHDCQVRNAADAGVLIVGENAYVLLDGCTISANRGSGVVVKEDARAWIVDTTISENAEHGLWVQRTASRTILEASKISHNGAEGLQDDSRNQVDQRGQNSIEGG